MLGIFRLMVLAACFDSTTAGPRFRAAWEMHKSGPLQAEEHSMSLPHHHHHHHHHHHLPHHHHHHHHQAHHTFPKRILPPPVFLGFQHPREMIPRLECTTTTHKKESPRLCKTKPKVPPEEETIMKAPLKTSTGLLQEPRGTPEQPTTPSKWQLLGISKRQLIKLPAKERRGSSRVRRSVGARVQVERRGHRDIMFRMQGDLPLYLMPNSSGSSLMLAPHHPHLTCFRAHTFNTLPPSAEGGTVVVLETHNRGHYLHTNTTTGSLYLESRPEGLGTVTTLDNRFFRLYSPVGDSHTRIKHMITDLHLQAGENEVTMVSTDPRAADGMHFQDYNCSLP